MISVIKNLINPTPTKTYLQNFNAALTNLPPTPKTATPLAIPSPSTLNKDANTQNALKSVKLIMVTAANNNKYYEMQENGNDTFTVIYGRIGATGATRTYPIREWDKKYREKVVDIELDFSPTPEECVEAVFASTLSIPVKLNTLKATIDIKLILIIFIKTSV